MHKPSQKLICSAESRHTGNFRTGQQAVESSDRQTDRRTTFRPIKISAFMQPKKDYGLYKKKRTLQLGYRL